MLFLDTDANGLKKILEDYKIFYSEVDLINIKDKKSLGEVETFSSIILHQDCLKNADSELTEFLNLFNSVVTIGSSKETLVLDNQIAHFDEGSSSQRNLFKNLVNYLFDLEYKGEDFNQDLSLLNTQVTNLLDRVNQELERVKAIHKAFVPVRRTEVRGLHFQTKFLTGLKSGGDFFDIIEGKNKLTLLMSSVNKYSASSILLTHFLNLKQENEVDEKKITQMIKLVSNDYREANSKNDIEMGLLCLTIDLKTFEISGYSFGDFRIAFANGKIERTVVKNVDIDQLSQAKVHLKLERDSRLLIISPGVAKNWQIKNADNIDLRIEKFFKFSEDEILNELFYDLKRTDVEKFLDYDSSAIYMEIGKNALISI